MSHQAVAEPSDSQNSSHLCSLIEMSEHPAAPPLQEGGRFKMNEGARRSQREEQPNRDPVGGWGAQV
ncbi:hypothetical protein AMECASPLE_035375 [Ameca splendens]|uniref:Uncharacterized protein n=1 Tax=Ameca splendens TaxID=208324 RepID=A0ABV1A5W8_9TELE